jgi:small subunit ribosomal protein S21
LNQAIRATSTNSSTPPIVITDAEIAVAEKTFRTCSTIRSTHDSLAIQALKALKKKMQREGIFREMKLRGHYEKPSEKRAREKAEALRRARKLARKKLQREGLLPMKPKPIFGAR